MLLDSKDLLRDSWDAPALPHVPCGIKQGSWVLPEAWLDFISKEAASSHPHAPVSGRFRAPGRWTRLPTWPVSISLRAGLSRAALSGGPWLRRALLSPQDRAGGVASGHCRRTLLWDLAVCIPWAAKH